MTEKTFIEDIFVDFYLTMGNYYFIGNNNDFKIIKNFYSILVNGDLLTSGQASLMIKILKKYSNLLRSISENYETSLENPRWKNQFRVIDLSKKVFIKNNQKNQPEICLKFPYTYKEDFDNEFNVQNYENNYIYWDQIEKVRKVPLININVIKLYEWCKSRNFEFDQYFLDLVERVEILWSNENKFIPYVTIQDNKVVLVNADSIAENYFNNNKTGDKNKDLFLAKSMNFVFKNNKKANNIVEKICMQEQNFFWIKDNKLFFELFSLINQTVCILLDRACSKEAWLKKFVADSKEYGINTELIKICFRNHADSVGDLNQWIKENNFGGNVRSGKILIFENKPAKWLFKDNVDIKIICTNNLYANSNAWVNDWKHSHPCVIYLGDVKPTLSKVNDIVSL